MDGRPLGGAGRPAARRRRRAAGERSRRPRGASSAPARICWPTRQQRRRRRARRAGPGRAGQPRRERARRRPTSRRSICARRTPSRWRRERCGRRPAPTPRRWPRSTPRAFDAPWTAADILRFAEDPRRLRPGRRRRGRAGRLHPLPRHRRRGGGPDPGRAARPAPPRRRPRAGRGRRRCSAPPDRRAPCSWRWPTTIPAAIALYARRGFRGGRPPRRLLRPAGRAGASTRIVMRRTLNS